MAETYRSDVECRCEQCDDLIRLDDWIVELVGEVFHAECV